MDQLLVSYCTLHPPAVDFQLVSQSSLMAMSGEKDESSGASHDNDKGISSTAHVKPGNDRHHFDLSDLDRVQRRLKQRHVQMFVHSVYAPMVYH